MKNTARMVRKHLNSGDISFMGGTTKRRARGRAWEVSVPVYPLAGSMAISIFFSGYVSSAQLGVLFPGGVLADLRSMAELNSYASHQWGEE